MKASTIPNNTGFLAALNQGVTESSLPGAGTIVNQATRDLLAFEFQEDPRHEKEVSCPGLDCACSGKHQVGKPITDCAQTQLVARVVFAEQVDYIHCLPTLVFRIVQPCE
jgi:hypothetical protein